MELKKKKTTYILTNGDLVGVNGGDNGGAWIKALVFFIFSIEKI